MIGYNFEKPYKVINLPGYLKEISGLTYYHQNQLLCNQDESAEVYLVNYDSEKIEKIARSATSGDFEDIEFINGSIYLLKSNGTIYNFTCNSDSISEVIKYPTQLNEKNDTEGLAYYKQENSLLIACKSKPGIKNTILKDENVRCIYKFDLVTKQLIEKPFLTISLSELNTKYGFKKFMPSAIAVHPISGNIFLLSSVGRIILEVNVYGEIIATKKIQSSYFMQPEGICFDPEGAFLFISNEGKNNNANLLIFEKI